MKEFLTAWQFLTRIKLAKCGQFNQESLSRAYLYFPLVGLIIGTILALLGYGALLLFKPLTVAFLVVGAEIIITGGLHLDGFMDSCDGLFSGRDREKILEIMKDSRVGSMGVVGCLLLLGSKVGLLYELIGTPVFLPLLVILPLCSRWIMVIVMARYPSARSQGLGELFKAGIKRRNVLGMSVYCLAFTLLVIPLQLNVALVIALPVIWWVAGAINRSLAGHTGDTYGFMNEISGLIFLFSVTIGQRISNLFF